jgi:hypothetical protein
MQTIFAIKSISAKRGMKKLWFIRYRTILFHTYYLYILGADAKT